MGWIQGARSFAHAADACAPLRNANQTRNTKDREESRLCISRINLYVAAGRLLRVRIEPNPGGSADIAPQAALDSRTVAGWTRAARRVIVGC
jgi:hypothetical protein